MGDINIKVLIRVSGVIILLNGKVLPMGREGGFHDAGDEGVLKLL